MAGTADAALKALEGIGGNRTNYGMSGTANHLSALTGVGASYRHSAGAMTTPMQSMTITMRVGDKFAGLMKTPMQVVQGRGGDTAEMTTPMQVLAMTGTSPIIARAALVTPLQIVLATGRTGSKAGAALYTPMQVLFTRTGESVRLATPMQVLAGHVTAMEYARARLTTPFQSVVGTISVYSYPWRAALRTPMIVPGQYGRAALVTPMQQVFGTFLIPATAGDFEAWVMNTRNGAVTRWTNFPFTQFARVGKSTYAVGNGNLYLLGGDLDVTAPIAWSFETGIDNMDSPAIKHMPYLYIDGIIDGTIEIVLIDDRKREFGYEYGTKQRGAVHQQHRRKLGNGIRTVNVGFRFSSTTGAYIELDSFAPEVTNTQRNI